MNSTLDIEMLMAVVGFDPEDKLLWEKFALVLELIPRINGYLKEGLAEDRLVRPLAMKKIEQIKEATTKKQLQEIKEFPKVRYYPDGKIRATSEYALPEEELILWMQTCYHAPLRDEAYNRYFELFRLIFPDYADAVGL